MMTAKAAVAVRTYALQLMSVWLLIIRTATTAALQDIIAISTDASGTQGFRAGQLLSS